MRTRLCAALAFPMVLACGADPPHAKPPTAATSTAKASGVPTGGDLPDAAGALDVKEAGSTSDCIPRSPTDGDVAEALLSPAGDKLSICLAYHGDVAEARTGRACYEVDLGAGRYDRIGPFFSQASSGDALTASLARHPSANGGYVVTTTVTDVTACKGTDCFTVHAEGYKPAHAASGDDTCLPDALQHALPADVSPDGATVFLARHEACDGHVFGETYDAKTKKRVARFPLAADSFVERVTWFGHKVLVRTCMDDLKQCALSLVDPSAPATPTQHGFSNAIRLEGLNTAGLDPFLFHAKDDVWALVDRLGGSVVFVHADSGSVVSSLKLAAAPPMTRPIAVVPRATPSSQLCIVYGGSGLISLVDLTTMQLASTLSAPICGM